MIGLLRTRVPQLVQRRAFSAAAAAAPADVNLTKEIAVGLGLGCFFGFVWKIWADREMKKIDTFYDKLNAEKSA